MFIFSSVLSTTPSILIFFLVVVSGWSQQLFLDVVKLRVFLALEAHRDCTASLRLLWERVDVDMLLVFTDDKISLDHVSNVADVLIVHVLVAIVALTRRNEHSQKLEDSSVVLACSQGLHGRSDQVELLLQVVEANHGVDAVPVEHPVFNESRRD